MKKTYKQIEESRNNRLWITNVVLPTATLLTTLYAANQPFKYMVDSAITGVTNGVKSTASKVKNYFETKKKEKEDKVNA